MQIFIIILLSILLAACTNNPVRDQSMKKSEYVAMLLDPEVKKDFRALKKLASEAKLYSIYGKTHMSELDKQKATYITNKIIRYLSSQYHINVSQSRIHTYIGKNAYDSCYQYYNSLGNYYIGRTCTEFPRGFSSCQLCNTFIKKLRTPRSLGIMHIRWLNNQEATALVDTILLRNGEKGYVGLQLF